MNRTMLTYYLHHIFVLNYWAGVFISCVFIGLAATGYLGWGWALFGFTATWYLMHLNYLARRSNHLDFYIVYLLLHDGIRASQKKNFCEWICTDNAPNPSVLMKHAMAAIQRSADLLAAPDPKEPLSGSAYVSTGLMWQVKHPADKEAR